MSLAFKPKAETPDVYTIIQNLGFNDLSEKFWIATITKNISVIRSMPAHLITDAVFNSILDLGYIYLRKLPFTAFTPARINQILREDPKNLRYLNPLTRSKISSEVYLEILKTQGNLLVYVPEEVRTHRQIKTAMRSCNTLLSMVPKRYITKAYIDKALREDGWLIQAVPRDLITPKMCLLAVKTNWEVLAVISKQFVYDKLIYEAIKQNGLALAYVPENRRTDKMVALAVDYFKKKGYISQG